MEWSRYHMILSMLYIGICIYNYLHKVSICTEIMCQLTITNMYIYTLFDDDDVFFQVRSQMFDRENQQLDLINLR